MGLPTPCADATIFGYNRVLPTGQVRPVLLLIDNYDRFTYNLFHYLGELGADVRVVRNDEISAAEALALKPEGIVLSPGPCTPNEAGICLDVIKLADGKMPILGVRLGHPAIGQGCRGAAGRPPP